MAEIERARRAEDLRRDAILEAVAFAAERFLLVSDWRQAAAEVLARLGIAAGASRSYVFENEADGLGRPGTRLVSEWSAPGIEPQIENPALQSATWAESGLGRWAEAMERGESISGPVRSFPESEWALLEAQDIRSLAAFPVFVGRQWWGLIGLDDCTSDRLWTNTEIDALRAAASVLGAAVYRRRAEDQLRAAEHRYRVLVEKIPAVTYLEAVSSPDTDAMGNILYMSPQVERVLGYPPARWMADPGFWQSIVHPEDRTLFEEIVGHSNVDLQPTSQDFRMIAADGRVVWLHDEAVLIRDEDGAPQFWQGFFTDVTERRRAEEQARVAEERYRLLVERTPAISYQEVIDTDVAPGDSAAGSTMLYVSPQIERILGYPAERWATDPGFWVDIVHPDDRQAVLDEGGRAVESGEPYRQDYRMVAADGRVVWIHDESVLINDDHGRPLMWQGVMVDITERMEVEVRLRVAEEKFRTIVEQNQAIFYTQEIDPETGISRTNYVAPGNSDLIGYAVEDVLADSELWWKIIHPDDRARVLDADRQSNLGEIGEHFSEEYRVIHKDGHVVWVQDEARLVQIGEAKPHWQGFLLEITERKEAEERLGEALEREREATQRLRSLDEMKNTFLQAVSHDLRTPLAAILGLAITLERPDVELDEGDTQDLARRIADNARKLDRLVTNLLDLDRLARGIVEPKLHVTDLGALVRRALSEIDLLADSHVNIDIAEVVMPIDGAKVERIVENLLANAARHTPRGTTVWVRVQRVVEGGLILIEDDGPGVPPELREAIFEPFRQGPDAPQHSPGVGVGLALVRRFAELHGGRAWVEAREGGGASFRVLLPTPSGWLGPRPS